MTPLIYYLEVLDARVHVTILDLYEKVYLAGDKPLYEVLADKEFMNKYKNYNVDSVAISKREEKKVVYLRVTP